MYLRSRNQNRPYTTQFIIIFFIVHRLHELKLPRGSTVVVNTALQMVACVHNEHANLFIFKDTRDMFNNIN